MRLDRKLDGGLCGVDRRGNCSAQRTGSDGNAGAHDRKDQRIFGGSSTRLVTQKGLEHGHWIFLRLWFPASTTPGSIQCLQARIKPSHILSSDHMVTKFHVLKL